MADSGRPSTPSGRPMRACGETIERASSGRPVNWQPPPVSTSRRPAWMPWPAAFSRSRTSSRISSTRGRMMRTSSDLGTWLEWSMSSPTRWTRDRIALVRGRGDAGAVEGLEPFGVGEADGEAARDVHRHVRAADRDRVDVDDAAAGEHADRRRAGAEIDQRRAHLDLVVDQGRQAGGVRRRDHRRDAEVAALDRQHQVARRGGVAGGDVHFRAELVADHALGVAHAARRVEPEAGRRRVQHRAAGVGARRRGGLEHAMDLVLGRPPCRAARSWRRRAATTAGRRTC